MSDEYTTKQEILQKEIVLCHNFVLREGGGRGDRLVVEHWGVDLASDVKLVPQATGELNVIAWSNLWKLNPLTNIPLLVLHPSIFPFPSLTLPFFFAFFPLAFSSFLIINNSSLNELCSFTILLFFHKI